MRRKLLLGGLGLAMAVSVANGFGPSGSNQAIDCPVGGLETACGAASLVVSTACNVPISDSATVVFVTVDIEGGAPVQCPEI